MISLITCGVCLWVAAPIIVIVGIRKEYREAPATKPTLSPMTGRTEQPRKKFKLFDTTWTEKESK